MTYLSLAFGIGLSLSVGFFLTDILLRQIRTETWLKAWLGIGVGLGISSLTYFTWRLVIRPEGLVYFLAELVFAVGLGFVAFSLRRRVKAVEVLGLPLGQVRLPAVWSWLLNASLVIATISAGLNYLFGTLIRPHGAWDAWAIWNLAARFLYRGNSEWKNLFEPSIPHPDYPLLVPSNVARLWAYRGAVDFLAPTVIGFLFFLATLGLLLSLSALTRGRVSSRLAGLALIGCSTILITGPTKVADIPLGYYLLGALGCLSLYQKFTKPGFLILAGIFIGLGAWTKNEGWLLAIAVLSGWALTGLLFERRRFLTWIACVTPDG